MTVSPRRWPAAAVQLLAATITGSAALFVLGLTLAGVVLLPVLGVGIPVLAGALQAAHRLADGHLALTGRRRREPFPDETARPLGSLGIGSPGIGFLGARGRRTTVWVAAHGLVAAVVCGFGYGLWEVAVAFAGSGTRWILIPSVIVAAVVYLLVPWAVEVTTRIDAHLLGPLDDDLPGRVRELTASRAAAVDAQAAELRRIERDLHDGAQARLAAVGMTLGLAAQALDDDAVVDVSAARSLVDEARADTRRALAELRDLVRGVHPPVLADRGLAGGLEAAALLCAVPVDVDVDLPGRAEPAVESAAYFATSEALTNIGRHSGATGASLTVGHADGLLTVVVEDDGRGGADARSGTGLRGIERRLAAFDGTLVVASPPGGPTVLTMELPCTLVPSMSDPSRAGLVPSGPSSGRTMSSSVTG